MDPSLQCTLVEQSAPWDRSLQCTVVKQWAPWDFCRHAEQARAGAKLPEGISKARRMSAPSRSRDSNILICRPQDGGEKDRNTYMKGPAARVHGHLVHAPCRLDPSCVCLGFDPLSVGSSFKAPHLQICPTRTTQTMSARLPGSQGRRFCTAIHSHTGGQSGKGREEKERGTATWKNPGPGCQGGLTGCLLCRSGWCTVTLCSGADARTQTASVWARLHPCHRRD